jgi:putative membrane protein insertion efficiency factor
MPGEERKVQVNGDTYELAVGSEWQPFLQRVLTGATEIDREIDALPIPREPFRLRLAIKALRWYRAALSPRLGHRCVFEPSCSRYSELAIRDSGLFHGMVRTVRRLRRCRPGAGGFDLPKPGE